MPIIFRSACFFSTNNGATVGRRANAAEEKSAPLPNNVTNLLRLDETQPNNAALLAAWANDSAPFTMSGNSVLVNGQVAGIDPPSLAYEALENFNNLLVKSGTSDAWTQGEVAQVVNLVGFLFTGNPAAYK